MSCRWFNRTGQKEILPRSCFAKRLPHRHSYRKGDSRRSCRTKRCTVAKLLPYRNSCKNRRCFRRFCRHAGGQTGRYVRNAIAELFLHSGKLFCGWARLHRTRGHAAGRGEFPERHCCRTDECRRRYVVCPRGENCTERIREQYFSSYHHNRENYNF